MRILAIRGANLASLAVPFEINLAAEPIGDSGLFAITGETGAGKSTILDALCLALYGEYPRVSISRRENAPDPSGKAISVHDSRAILRRGAGGGYAEVDFVGQDGERYRVRWEANRARGRANGRLQDELRALSRLDDGATVATGKTQVLEAVEAKTDLTFDQFRRTVLLAQGEFDAFLLAAESERAELLEKITGTEIYAAISIRVHEGTDARRKAVEGLEWRRSEIGLLDAESRQGLINEQSLIAGQIDRQGAERERLNERLDHLKRVVAARDELAKAEIHADKARSARAAATEDYSALAELDLVEPLRPLSVDLNNACQTVTGLELRLTDLRLSLDEAQGYDGHAEKELTQAIEADHAAEEIFKQFGPLWSAAEKLDAELATAGVEFRDATEASQKAQVHLHHQSDVLDALEHSLTQTKESHEAALAQLEGRSGHALLADRLDDATALLEKRTILKSDCAAVASGAAEATTTAARLEGELKQLSEKLAADRDRKEILIVDIGEHQSRLAAINEPALHESETNLRRVLEGLREAGAACEQHVRGLTDLARAESERDAAKQELSVAKDQIAAAEFELVRDREARAEVAPLAELADEAVSREAVHLRSVLVSDAACPVCGSTNHPHLAQPSALNEMVAAVRRRRQELDASLAATSQRLDMAARALAAGEFRRSEASRGIAAAQGQMSAAEDLYNRQRPSMSALCATAGLASMPPAPSAGAVSELAALMASGAAQLDRTGASLAKARHLRAQKDDLQKKLDVLVATIELESRNLEKRRSELHDTQLKVTEHRVRGADIVERLCSIDREIAPFLAAANRTIEQFDADPKNVAAHILAVAQEYDALRERMAELDRTLRRLDPDRAAAIASLEHVKTQAAEAATRLDQRRSVLEEKKLARTKLLDGEPTASHRTRTNEARRSARESLAAAQDTKSASASALRVAGVRCEESIAAVEDAVRRHTSAEHAFNAGCDSIAASSDRVSLLLAADPAMCRALRDRTQELDRAVNVAGLAVLTRQNDLSKALEEFDETSDAGELSAAVALLTTEIEGLQHRKWGISARLLRDDEARQTAATLSAEVDVAKGELAIWQAVDDAVGSASGDRFRRFVQGITLDHLVQLANDHLNALSPRYRLARGASSDLTLHIIDRDMGDEVRATRSLSGGERFLVSLALALALSGLEGRSSFVDTLFIDEGFGSLDAETLDMVVDALETLHGRGQKVGIITHVAAMIDRISVQVRVEKRGAGRSEILIADGLTPARPTSGAPSHNSLQ